jgi:hypothetical protein
LAKGGATRPHWPPTGHRLHPTGSGASPGPTGGGGPKAKGSYTHRERAPHSDQRGSRPLPLTGLREPHTRPHWPPTGQRPTGHLTPSDAHRGLWPPPHTTGPHWPKEASHSDLTLRVRLYLATKGAAPPHWPTYRPSDAPTGRRVFWPPPPHTGQRSGRPPIGEPPSHWPSGEATHWPQLATKRASKGLGRDRLTANCKVTPYFSAPKKNFRVQKIHTKKSIGD